MKKHKTSSLTWAHPIIREWFLSKFGAPTEPQIQGWPSILAGKTTLISAPTGSGKTLAAFLACMDQLVRAAAKGKLPDETQVLYVSPLKALSNDIQKNLLAPLAEMNMESIRVAVRTGDTLAKERQAMLKKPPHILVTTPESLYILLTAEKSRAMLSTVKTIIVDEIHAMVNDKRGTHLALSLARLDALTKKPAVRIGLSATQKPLARVAQFLTGVTNRKSTIVDIGHARQLDLAIEVPKMELGAVASNEMWDEIYDRLAELAKENRSTLIFVNTRRLAERVAHHLRERLGEDKVAAHHGSLSRKLRLQVENKLKSGELTALVATASLELGIDIGTVDLVCQVGSPRAIATALQRVGRAGHWHRAISKGRIFATTRDELIECAATVKAIREGDLDQLIIPHEPLDILAQQMVATCATNEWHEDELFALIKKSDPFKKTTRETFNEVLAMLSDGIAGSRGRYGAYLFWDRVNHIVKARRGARLTAITSGGAIPDNGLFTVIAEPAGTMVGTLDEDFAVESNRGDIILLGNTSWQIMRIEAATGKVIVEDAHGAPPSVPFWRGEAPARTNELSLHVSLLREELSKKISNEKKASQWLQQTCGVSEYAAKQLIEYVKQAKAVLGTIPSQQTVIAERFFDEAGGMQLIIHAPFGARINKAWGLALRKRFCRSFNFELQAAATDDGINISLAEQHSFPLIDVFQFLHPNTVKEVVTQAVLQSPIFATRWRWDAARALALVRFRGGKKVPPNILRMLSEDLLAAVFPDAAACQDNLGGKYIELPDHPLVREAMKDVLTEAMDVDGLIEVLKKINNGEINCLAVDSPLPSVLAHEILNANPYAYLDDAPLEERRARAVEMRRVLPATVLEEVGRLDPEVIIEVQQQAWPDIRSADELHDVLQTLITAPPKPEWQQWVDELLVEKRIVMTLVEDEIYLVAAEKLQTFIAVYPQAILTTPIASIAQDTPQREEALVQMVRGWMLHLGPATAQELSQLLSVEVSDIDQAFLKLETTGLILRGNFRQQGEAIEWCERRLLARIHRLTVAKLRKEIEPVTPQQFMQWLLHWHHLTPASKTNGEQGLLEIVRQMQGFEIPANAWESQIFSKRMTDYSPEILDHLCLMGVIGWGRYSSHPVIGNDTRRIMPSSVAPITFFVREDAQWLSQGKIDVQQIESLSRVAKNVYEFLTNKGASFFNDITRGVGHLNAEVETALWELVTIGAITADGFDNLRALINPKRRLDKRRRRIQTRYSSGRWSLLYHDENVDHDKRIEAMCWMLLHRYGVVFRDLLTREKNIPRWRDLLLAFRRLEDRGEIRGGRFVGGFAGEQFALPYAVESLRAIKKEIKQESVSISTVDPLNLVGIIVPGAKVSAASRKTITL